MSIRQKTVHALGQYDGGHNARVASFPPFPPKNQNAPPPPPGGPSKRNIPTEHAYDPKALKPMSKALYAASVALGHSLAAYREFSRVKSATVSPDGMLGGRGYVMGIRDMRQRMYDASEALSAVVDTLHDEINAPHWKPKLAMLDENDAEDVERFVEEAQDVMENPEGEATEKIDEIEEANDGKKSKKDDEPSASETPGGGDETEEDAPQAQTKTASNSLEQGVKGLALKLGALAKQIKAGEEIPIVQVLASLGQEVSQLRRSVDRSAVLPLEVGGYLKEVGKFLNQAKRRPERALVAVERAAKDAIELNALFTGGLRVACGGTCGGSCQGNCQGSCEGSCDCGGPRVKNREPEGGPGPQGAWNDDDLPPADNWEADDGGVARRDDFGENYDFQSEWENEAVTAADQWAADVEAEVWANSVMPDDPETETGAWDFGLGFGAKGQGAGNYANPSSEGKGKGIWGPHAELPGTPDQSSGDTSTQVDEAINRLATRADVDAWVQRGISEYGSKLAFLSSEEYRFAYPHIAEVYADSELPQDATGTPARSDYYPGSKDDNLVQAEASAWAESVLPDAQAAPVDHKVVDESDALYVHEDTATPYNAYDYKTNWPEQDRPDEQPFAQDGEATR